MHGSDMPSGNGLHVVPSRTIEATSTTTDKTMQALRKTLLVLLLALVASGLSSCASFDDGSQANIPININVPSPSFSVF